MDEKVERPAPATPPAPAKTPVVPRPRPVLTRPAPLATPVDYPEAGEGEQEVALELLISAEGAVTDVALLEGAAPFAESALSAARSWRFQPATRDGKPVAAKIRYRVRFVPPSDEPAPEAAEPSPAPAAASDSTGAPDTLAPVKEAPYEIVVLGTRAPIRHQLGRADVHDMPGAFGDPYRAIEVLPGVVPIVSGLPYFYVRGAPPGNVGYFFDGIPVPFLYHFAAGPGVLHPAFVETVDLYPGAYPVRYGRFAGAIVAGEMAPPGYRLRGEASIRVVDSGAMVEAPFADGRGSVMVGGRYSYTALVLSLIVPEVTVSYWDYQTRARYQLDANDSIELLAFGSGDFVSETETVTLTPRDEAEGFRRVERENTLVNVGFHRLDLRWDHGLQRGNWRNALLLGRDRTAGDNDSVSVTNWMLGVRSEVEKVLEPGLTFRAGADALVESLSQEVDYDNNDDGGSFERAPSGSEAIGERPDVAAQIIEMPEDEDPDFGFSRARRDFTAGAWADVVWDVARNVRITPGVRFDVFVSGKQAAIGVDPRITAEFNLARGLSMTHGLALAHQAPSFIVPVPGLKSSLEGGLQRAVQHSVGLNYALPSGISASLAVFQNAFFNMTDFISLLQLESSTGEDLVEFRTRGHAYGAELMLRRSLAQDLGGFVSYTLSRSVRSARRLRGPASTDRTHVLNVGASYNLGREWRLGGRVILYSGIPAEVAYLEAATAPPRTPPFWRLDFKLQKRWYVKRPSAWWGLAVEVLNTTLNKEQLSGGCNAYTCSFEGIGPITVPSIGFEGAF